MARGGPISLLNGSRKIIFLQLIHLAPLLRLVFLVKADVTRRRCDSRRSIVILFELVHLTLPIAGYLPIVLPFFSLLVHCQFFLLLRSDTFELRRIIVQPVVFAVRRILKFNRFLRGPSGIWYLLRIRRARTGCSRVQLVDLSARIRR
jgi:hypothetical protein